MTEFECRLKQPGSFWRSVGEHETRFAAVTDYLCQISGRGGQDVSLEEIACRPVATPTAEGDG